MDISPSPSAPGPLPLTRRLAEWGPWIGLALLVLIWSGGWTTMKVATAYAGPMTFSLHRYLLGVVVLFAVLLLWRRDLKPTPFWPTIAIGAAQTAAFQAFEQWALMSGGAGKTALLAYTMPFFVVPLSWWWVKERPRTSHWAAIAVAAIGFLLVVAPWSMTGTRLSSLLAIIGGFGWAIGTVLSRRVFLRHPEVKPLNLTAWQMLAGTVILWGVTLLSGEGAASWQAPYLGAVLYNGVLSSALCWVLWSVLVQRLSANIAGFISLFVPVVTVLFAGIFLGERLTGGNWAGLALVAAALLFMARTPLAKPAQ